MQKLEYYDALSNLVTGRCPHMYCYTSVSVQLPSNLALIAVGVELWQHCHGGQEGILIVMYMAKRNFNVDKVVKEYDKKFKMLPMTLLLLLPISYIYQ